MTEWADEFSSFASTSRSVSNRSRRRIDGRASSEKKRVRGPNARAENDGTCGSSRNRPPNVRSRPRRGCAGDGDDATLATLPDTRFIHSAHCTHVIHVHIHTVRFISVRGSARVVVGPYAARRLRRGVRRRRRPRPGSSVSQNPKRTEISPSGRRLRAASHVTSASFSSPSDGVAPHKAFRLWSRPEPGFALSGTPRRVYHPFRLLPEGAEGHNYKHAVSVTAVFF